MPHSVEGLPSNLLYSKCVIVAITFVMTLLFAILPVFEEVILILLSSNHSCLELGSAPGHLYCEQFLVTVTSVR